MNLIYVPQEPLLLHTGDEFSLVLPAGEYPFLIATDDVFGQFGACSLFSPVLEFADQASALLTAEAALDGLFAEQQVASVEDSGSKPSGTDTGLTRRQLFGGER
jgi:[NiFe] hydrogenase assembly HybE family chaperone